MSVQEQVVYVVDDDQGMLDSTVWLLESVGLKALPFTSGRAFLEACDRQRNSCVLLDVRMQPWSGLVTFEHFQRLDCPWPVLFLTGHGDVSTAVQAVKNGAWDFLEKPFQDNQLVDRVAQALHAAAAQRQNQRHSQRLRQALASLSPREREVLDELLRGHYNKNIAEHLGITQRTVEFHRANIFEKMGVESAIELAHQLGKLQH